MAIKLQVQDQLGGRTGFAAASQIQRGVDTFGNIRQQAINLPTENVGGNISAILAAGEAAGRASQQIGKGLQSISESLVGMAKAEDDTNAQKALVEIDKIHSDVRNKNLERASKGEITYSQLAEENRKEIEAATATYIDGVQFNLPSTRDNLKLKNQSVINDKFDIDTKLGIEQIAKEKKQGFLNTVDNVLSTVKDGPEGFASASKAIQTIYDDPMTTVLGFETVKAHIKEKTDESIKDYLSGIITKDPKKFLSLMDEGRLDGMLIYKSEEEKQLYKDAANLQIIKNDNAALEQYNKQSDKLKDTMSLQMATGTVIPVQDILSNPNLSDQHKTQLVNQSNELSGNTIAKQRQRNEMNQKVQSAGGWLGVLNAEENDMYMRENFPGLYENAFKDQRNAVSSIIGIQNAGGIPPEGMITFAVAELPSNSTPEDQRTWSQNVLQLNKSLDPKSKNSDKVQQSTDIALRMTNFGEDFNTAKTNLSSKENIDKLTKSFDPTEWDKHSAYKDAPNFIADKLGVDAEKIPLDSVVKFKEQVKLESIKGGTKDEITQRAIDKLNLSKVEMPNGEVFVMPNAPIIHNKFKEKWNSELKVKLEENGIKKGALKPQVNFDPNKPSYYITDDNGYPKYDKNGDLVTISPDFQKWVDELQQEKTAKESVPRTSLGYSLAGTQLSIIEHSYPNTLGKYKGVLDAMWLAESARGKNLKSPVGAEGHFQFMPDTAKQYGVDNPYDFKQSSEGAGKMMNEMLSKYNGNLNYALAAYNWGTGNVDKWIKNGAKFENLPSETQNYVTKINKTMQG
jgi:hypothetical protein